MKRSLRLFSLLTAAALLWPLAAAAQGRSPEPQTRRFVIFSDDPDVQASVPTRHFFPGKFTAKLTLGQAHALGLQGFRLEPVKLFHPTKPPGSCTPWPECKNGGGDGGDTGDTSRTATPDDQAPWGIETIYNDPGIASTSGGAGINVAVLDTGVSKDHLDLVNRVAGCVDFSRKKEPIVDGSCPDRDGHGTHVAGTIAADGGGDGLGIYGVAPNANILAYKVCGGGGCWTDDIAAAIDYAGGHGAHIVSMSLGGDSESTLIRDAIGRNPSLLFVAAAGNDGSAVGSIDYPGANPNVIAVGAIDSNMQVAWWSSRGINNGDCSIEAREVELSAPGVSVESTWKDGGYDYLSGTSMATPHVSGLAAKLWQGNADYTRAHLQSIAERACPTDTATGFGLPQVGP
jgi:subtilisin